MQLQPIFTFVLWNCFYSSFGLLVLRSSVHNFMGTHAPSHGRFVSGTRYCREGNPIQYLSPPLKSEETEIDQRLRKFFSDDAQFNVARQVIESFMIEFAAGSCDQPLLYRCARTCNAKDDDRSVDDAFSDLFKPIYEPPTNFDNTSPTGTEEVNTRKRRGQSFKLHIAYRGKDFCGWQIQPNNDVPSIQETLIDHLDPILNTDFKKPIDIRVCGRTDAGVSAIGQYCRVRTLQPEDAVGPIAIQQAINQASLEECDERGPALLCTKAERVNDKFHPTFGATCRAYLYLIDSDPILELTNDFQCNDSSILIHDVVSLLDAMLSKLQGQELDYFALSFGKVKTTTTLCTMLRCRALLVETRDGQKAIGIELVGDRFLRRMVRILVATSIREVIQVLEENASKGERSQSLEDEEFRLLKLVNGLDRVYSAKSAASDGLMFVGATFS